MKQGWEIKRLGDVCNVLNGLWIGKKEPFINICVIRNTNFTKDCKLTLDNVAYIDAEAKQFASRKLLVGDIIVEKSGGSEKQPVGRVVLFDIVGGDYSFSNFTSALRVKDGVDVIPKYLHRCLYAHYLRGETYKLQSKTTGLHNLDMKGYLRLPIPVPPIAEQERIVAELDCLSGIIEKKKQQLKELDNLAQSIFYEMFGDPVENDKGWDIYALSKNVKVKGRVGWKGYKKEDLRDSGPIAIGGGHLTDSGGLDLSSPVFLSMEKYLESPEIMIEVGDIILVQRGTIGKVGLIATDIGMATINPCVLILRPENLNSIYLLHYFLNEAIQTHLKTLIKGVAQPMITQQQVNGLLLPMPPLYLQQDFASKIESIEKQKELISKSIKETETLFHSRMDYYFG